MEPGQKLGPYEIRSPLGKGGMGEVYKAYDPALDRFVAIKILPPALSLDEALRSRFHSEALALAKVRHPNLVHIYTVGEERGINYFAMEYIQGRSLLSLLEAHGRLSVKKAFFVAGEVLSALSKVHEAGLVHRDIKPGNIMIERDGRVVLMDLGLAKTDDNTTATQDGTILGTPQYVSPEQAQGEAVDHRSDLYSLGVVLYETVAGDPPFTGKSAFAVIRQHVDTLPPPIESRVPDIPPEARLAIHRALEKDRAKRFQDAAEMAAAMCAVTRTKSLRALVREAEKKGRTLPDYRAGRSEGAPESAPVPGPEAGAAALRGARRRRVQWLMIAGLYLLAVMLTVAVVIALLRSGRRVRPPPLPAGRTMSAEIETSDGRTIRGRVLSYSEKERAFVILLPDGGRTLLGVSEVRAIRKAGGERE